SAGLDAAEAEFLDFVRSYNAGRLAVLTKVRLPAAAPNIFAGLKVSVTLAIVGAVVAEFVQSSNGLGYIILSAQSQLNTLVAFAAATLLVLMGFGLYAAILVLEHLLVSWEH
ncbi:MAG: ABC transporter permease subunit, partial [Nitrososphaerota archaeon]|nr:ABC transporter permease subunit [Nitrososphaerota archaeon]